MSKNVINRAMLATMAVAIGGVSTLASDEAEARGPRFQQWTYESERPLKGYEGFLEPGTYCSYRRFPVRVCNYDSRGREVCKIKGWRMEQSCS